MVGRNARWLRPLLILYKVGPGGAGAVPGFESRVCSQRTVPHRIASHRSAPLPSRPPASPGPLAAGECGEPGRVGGLCPLPGGMGA